MQLPRTPAAVIFDMDGLLFDTEALYRDAFFVTSARLGLSLPMEMFLSLVGRPWEVNRAALRAHLPTDQAVEDFRTAWAADFRVLLETGLRVKPGVLELLDLLDRQGVPRAIATSSGHAEVRHHLGASGLEGRFHAIVAHGDYAAGKPSPDPFLRAAELLGMTPADCLVLEDSFAGVRAADAAGMMVVMVPDLLPADDDIRPICTFVAESLHDVCGCMSTAA